MNPNKKLIILDLYKTIWGSNLPLRNGLYEFLNRDPKKIFTICTDDPDKNEVNKLLTELNIQNNFDSIYTYEDMIKLETHMFPNGKDLTQICKDYQISKKETIFIGDSDRDRTDAQREGISFIHVPEYTKQSEQFSFDLININNITQRDRDLRDIK